MSRIRWVTTCLAFVLLAACVQIASGSIMVADVGAAACGAADASHHGQSGEVPGERDPDCWRQMPCQQTGGSGMSGAVNTVTSNGQSPVVLCSMLCLPPLEDCGRMRQARCFDVPDPPPSSLFRPPRWD